MLEHVSKQNLLNRAIGPRPRKYFEVHNLIGVAGSDLINVDPCGNLVVATTEIETHFIVPNRGPKAAQLRAESLSNCSPPVAVKGLADILQKSHDAFISSLCGFILRSEGFR